MHNSPKPGENRSLRLAEKKKENGSRYGGFMAIYHDGRRQTKIPKNKSQVLKKERFPVILVCCKKFFSDNYMSEVPTKLPFDSPEVAKESLKNVPRHESHFVFFEESGN